MDQLDHADIARGSGQRRCCRGIGQVRFGTVLVVVPTVVQSHADSVAQVPSCRTPRRAGGLEIIGAGLFLCGQPRAVEAERNTVWKVHSGHRARLRIRSGDDQQSAGHVDAVVRVGDPPAMGRVGSPGDGTNVCSPPASEPPDHTSKVPVWVSPAGAASDLWTLRLTPGIRNDRPRTSSNWSAQARLERYSRRATVQIRRDTDHESGADWHAGAWPNTHELRPHEEAPMRGGMRREARRRNWVSIMWRRQRQKSSPRCRAMISWSRPTR